jgi:hypothetical protein
MVCQFRNLSFLESNSCCFPVQGKKVSILRTAVQMVAIDIAMSTTVVAYKRGAPFVAKQASFTLQ